MDAMIRLLAVCLVLTAAACGGSSASGPTPTAPAVATSTRVPEKNALLSEAGLFWHAAIKDGLYLSSSTVNSICTNAIAALTDPGSSDAEERDADRLTDLVCVPAAGRDWEQARLGWTAIDLSTR